MSRGWMWPAKTANCNSVGSWEQRAGWKQDLLAGHWWGIGSVDSGWWAVSLLKVISSLRAGRMPHSFLGSSSLPSRVFAHGGTFKDICIWILKQSCITDSIVMLFPGSQSEWVAEPGLELGSPDPWVWVLSIWPSFIARELWVPWAQLDSASTSWKKIVGSPELRMHGWAPKGQQSQPTTCDGQNSEITLTLRSPCCVYDV